MLRGEDGCEDVPSVGGDGVTVSGVDFSDEAVGPEHAKLTGNTGGPVVAHGRIFEESVVVGIEELGEFMENGNQL